MTLYMIPVPLLRLLCSTYTVLVTDLSTEPRSKPCQMVWQERGYRTYKSTVVDLGPSIIDCLHFLWCKVRKALRCDILLHALFL